LAAACIAVGERSVLTFMLPSLHRVLQLEIRFVSDVLKTRVRDKIVIKIMIVD
jgi:hypothetical protein